MCVLADAALLSDDIKLLSGGHVPHCVPCIPLFMAIAADAA